MCIVYAFKLLKIKPKLLWLCHTASLIFWTTTNLCTLSDKISDIKSIKSLEYINTTHVNLFFGQFIPQFDGAIYSTVWMWMGKMIAGPCEDSVLKFAVVDSGLLFDAVFCWISNTWVNFHNFFGHSEKHGCFCLLPSLFKGWPLDIFHHICNTTVDLLSPVTAQNALFVPALNASSVWQFHPRDAIRLF